MEIWQVLKTVRQRNNRWPKRGKIISMLEHWIAQSLAIIIASGLTSAIFITAVAI
jgi:hypothetical protein